jgi:hypothetical protein
MVLIRLNFVHICTVTLKILKVKLTVYLQIKTVTHDNKKVTYG